MTKKLDFTTWKILVDKECVKRCGMTTDDLPDCCYHDWWQDGKTPTAAARRAISEAKDY